MHSDEVTHVQFLYVKEISITLLSNDDEVTQEWPGPLTQCKETPC